MKHLLSGFLLLLVAGAAQAHKASTSYLHLRVDGNRIGGQWDIALRDLDHAIGLDADGDGNLTWGEVRRSAERIDAYSLARLRVRSQGADCPLHATDLRIAEHSDGHYAVLFLDGQCDSAPHRLDLDYSLFFDLDALHRGLLNLRLGSNGSIQSGVFAPDERSLQFGAAQGWSRVFAEYFRAGLFHVWTGLDHMLFLAGLFLPAVLRRQGRDWIAAPSLVPAMRDTAVMVTAFTLAHACTLTLAAVGAISPPSRWVESAVAATVLFAGLNNLTPMVYRELFWLAGLFGFIHGAAIAGALVELGLPPGSRVWALLAFNLGVEAAQLSVLCAVIPPSFLLRRSPWYRRLALIPGSVGVTLTGLAWLLERGAGIALGVPLP